MHKKKILFLILFLFQNHIFSQEYLKETINGEDVIFKKYSGKDKKNIDNVISISKNGIIYLRIFDESVNARWYGAKGDGITDDTEAIQKAINSLYPVKLNRGVYMVSSLVLPYEFAGLSIEGSGFNHWHDNDGTVLKAISSKPIINPANGCDWVKIRNIRLDGNGIGSIGYNGVFGGGTIFENVGIYNFINYGIYSKQGLLRISNSFVSNNGIGVQLFSDSSITNTEITGGKICLFLMGGGNRGNDLWLNSATKNLLVLEPDNKTGHQNTSFNNLYLGEVKNSTNSDVFQVLIKGNNIKRVQQVQISNSFFVHATDTGGSNSFFKIENADEIIISNCNFLGEHTYSNNKKFTNNFVNASNSNNIKIVNNIIKGINNTAISIGVNSYDWSIIGNDFIDCSGKNDHAIITMFDPIGSRALITNNKFIDARGNKNIFALKSFHDSGYFFKNNQIVYPNATIFENKIEKSSNIDNNFR